MYAWGKYPASLGFCSESDNQPVLTPKNVKGTINGKKVVSIAAGFQHSVAITESGKVYTWGMNDYGQCGGSQPIYWTPTLLKSKSIADKKIIQACCGGYHTTLLSEDRKVFTMGWSNMGKYHILLSVF